MGGGRVGVWWSGGGGVDTEEGEDGEGEGEEGEGIVKVVALRRRGSSMDFCVYILAESGIYGAYTLY